MAAALNWAAICFKEDSNSLAIIFASYKLLIVFSNCKMRWNVALFRGGDGITAIPMAMSWPFLFHCIFLVPGFMLCCLDAYGV
jgi:hypothetical protein